MLKNTCTTWVLLNNPDPFSVPWQRRSEETRTFPGGMRAQKRELMFEVADSVTSRGQLDTGANVITHPLKTLYRIKFWDFFILQYCECSKNSGCVPKIMCLGCVQSDVSTCTPKLACLCPRAFEKLLIRRRPVCFLSPSDLGTFSHLRMSSPSMSYDI